MTFEGPTVSMKQNKAKEKRTKSRLIKNLEFFFYKIRLILIRKKSYFTLINSRGSISYTIINENDIKSMIIYLLVKKKKSYATHVCRQNYL